MHMYENSTQTFDKSVTDSTDQGENEIYLHVRHGGGGGGTGKRHTYRVG